MTQQHTEQELYDPTQHTVAEVNDHLAGADDTERDRVLELERAGQNRKTIAGVAPVVATTAATEPVTLSTRRILAAVNADPDGVPAVEEDPDTVEALQRALYRFGAQDPSLELPRSWQRVQRRIGVDPDKLDGIATAEQVEQFARKAGIELVR